MRTSNPALGEKAFDNLSPISGQESIMTVQGTVNKAFILAFLVLASAAWTWSLSLSAHNPDIISLFMFAGAIGGFIFALITIFKKTFSPVTAPIYAVLEGLFIGGLSLTLEVKFPGIAIQAAGLTFGILFFMLFLFKTGILKATKKFTICVVSATGGIALVYIASMIMGFFGMSVPLISSNGIWGIGFSLFVVVIASLNFILDFDLIEYGANNGAPKYMEWYTAFGLMVTLVWLYIEILRLLSKLRSR